MKTLVIALLFLLVGCTVVLPSHTGQYEHYSWSYERGSVPAPPAKEPVVASTPPPCVYVRPIREGVPLLPAFTRKDVHDGDGLSSKLGAYVDVLREYVQREHQAEDDAYRRYEEKCLARK